MLITTTDSVDSTGAVVTGADTSYKLTDDTVIVGVKSADQAGSTVNVPVIYSQVFGQDFNNVIVVYPLLSPTTARCRPSSWTRTTRCRRPWAALPTWLPVVLNSSATVASVKLMADGAYVPTSISTLPANASQHTAANMMIFKFTASTTVDQAYTLVIDSATVYSETSTSFTKNTGGHFFYVDITGSYNGGTGSLAGDNVTGTALTSGVHTYEIKGADGVGLRQRQLQCLSFHCSNLNRNTANRNTPSSEGVSCLSIRWLRKCKCGINCIPDLRSCTGNRPHSWPGIPLQ